MSFANSLLLLLVSLFAALANAQSPPPPALRVTPATQTPWCVPSPAHRVFSPPLPDTRPGWPDHRVLTLVTDGPQERPQEDLNRSGRWPRPGHRPAAPHLHRLLLPPQARTGAFPHAPTEFSLSTAAC